MKKYFFIAAIALLGAGCTDDVNSPVDVDGSNEYYYSEFLVDEDDAYMQVLNFFRGGSIGNKNFLKIFKL